MGKKRMPTPVEQLQFVSGQLAALETLVQSLYLAHPDKELVQRIFTAESSEAAPALEPPTPVPFRDGYVQRAEAITAYLEAGRSRAEAPGSEHRH